jgi:MerR family transcriptional regulator, light-induced transcriptional regulator
MPDPTEPRHPIAVVEERTGLTQDVLRVWERRYNAVTPGRSAGGQRRYSDADIERLRLLQALTRGGRSIGQVADLPTAEIARLAREDAAARMPGDSSGADGAWGRATEIVEQAIAHVRALDAARLDAGIRRALALFGLPVFLEAVATPILRRIGDEWHAGRLTPAQEHLASAALHDLIAESTRGMVADDGAPRVLIATPAGERHAIGALLVGAAAATEGWHVISLGPDLPAADIAEAADSTGAALVAVSLLYIPDAQRTVAELRALRARLPAGIELLAGGPGAVALTDALAGSGIRIGTTLDDLRDTLRERRARPLP